jgi:hypothetical protein
VAISSIPTRAATIVVLCGEGVNRNSTVKVGEMVVVFNGEMQAAKNSDSADATKSFILIPLTCFALLL